jgi:hypothetical protein
MLASAQSTRYCRGNVLYACIQSRAMKPPRHSTVLNPLGSDFDRFLYAEVGDDHRGGQLSVVSALARSGVDPWDEAARLAAMIKEVAARALADLLARLPAGSGQPVDPLSVATRLVSLLPRGSH